MDHVRQFREYGYAVVRGVFDAAEVAELAAAFDRIYAAGMGHPRSFRHGNTFYQISEDPALGRIMRMMQWPSYVDPVLERYRRDPRMLEILAPLIGRDLKQIINQMHWKPPGAAMVEFGYHQDIRSRRPRTAYRDPAGSYIQTGIAVDPHRIENGAMTVYDGSHRLGELPVVRTGRIMDRPLTEDDANEFGLEPDMRKPLLLEPGDVAFWHLFMVHGSGPNTSAIDRRFYLNGYVKAASCDRGEWAFRDGRPVPLGAPVLVHYEDLHARPEPHYVGD